MTNILDSFKHITRTRSSTLTDHRTEVKLITFKCRHARQLIFKNETAGK